MLREKAPTRLAVRRSRRASHARFSAVWQGPVACLLLVACLLACVGYVSSPTGQRLDFPVDQLPLGVGLRNTYGIERNTTGPYVWTKTYTLLTLPVERPRPGGGGYPP